MDFSCPVIAMHQQCAWTHLILRLHTHWCTHGHRYICCVGRVLPVPEDTMTVTLRRRNNDSEHVPVIKDFRTVTLSGCNKGLVWFSLFDLLVFRELQHGIPITDENDNRLGESKKAAQQAISQVVVSRILMASPGMGTNIAASVIRIAYLMWGSLKEK